VIVGHPAVEDERKLTQTEAAKSIATTATELNAGSAARSPRGTNLLAILHPRAEAAVKRS